jgi:hypothetical protein
MLSFLDKNPIVHRVYNFSFNPETRHVYQIWIFRAFSRIASRVGFFRAGLKSEKCEPVYSRAGLKSSWDKQQSGSIRLDPTR